MLTREEREEVQALFADALAAENVARQLVERIFLNDAGPILLAVPPGTNKFSDIASFVITACLDSRWTKNPALLDLLLTYLIDVRGQAQFSDIQTRVRQRIDPNPTLYDVAWMSGKRPFFDRGDFRNRVAALVDENARPILRITSRPDSFGRTYGTRFLEHLSDVLPGNMQVVSVELSPKTGPSYRPEDLASAVASQVGFGPTAPARSSSDYASTAAQWILGILIGQPGRWLIVLDGFGQELKDETRLTIEGLAAMVPTGQYRKRIRLVLVDYGRDLPGVTLADTLEESLQPVTALAPIHVQACLVEMNARRQVEGREPLPAAQLAAIAAGMLAQAPPTGKERLAKLNEKLILLHDAPIEQILQGAGNGG